MNRISGFLLAVLAIAPGSALASPLLEAAGSLGGNAGEQGVVSGPGSASAYFNPALLVDAEDEVLFGLAIISEQVGVTLRGRNGGDVPLAVSGRDIIQPNGQPLSNTVIPTQWISQGCPPGSSEGTCPGNGFAARPRQAAGTSGKSRTYATIGLTKQLVKDRFAFAIYAMLPISNFTTAQSFYPDEREALFSNSLHPELYGDRLTSVSLVLGTAFRILPSLSLGAGISFGLANQATAASYVQDPNDYSTLLLNNGVRTDVSLSPTLGISYTPASYFKLGATLHAPEAFRLNTQISAALPSGSESSGSAQQVFDYTPWSVVAGVSLDVLRSRRLKMSLVASVQYSEWSNYQDRQGQSPGTAYGSRFAWHDTLTETVGLRYEMGRSRAFVDLRYAPSPVPAQTGDSNYVDNNRAGIAAGADIDIPIGRTHLRPGVQGFADRLIPRWNTKDNSLIRDQLPDGSLFSSTHDPVPGSAGLQTNNPGWPGFGSSGWILGGAVTLSVPL